MQAGFIKLFRQIKGHWLCERPEWFQGWMFIVMAGGWEDGPEYGRVNLTSVYRDLSHLFTKDQWRYFIKKLVAADMLEISQTINRGDKSGYEQTAIITNYRKYHERRSDKRSEDAANTREEHSDTPTSTAQTPPHDAAETQRARDHDAAQNAVYKEYIPKEVKEDQEINPKPLVCSRRRDAETLLEIYNTNRGLLPEALVLNRTREKKLLKLSKEFGLEPASEYLKRATREAANDLFWVEKKFNLDNLLADGRVIQKAEQNHSRQTSTFSGGAPMSSANLRLAQNAHDMLSALKGVN